METFYGDNLTDTIENYRNHIDELEYQMIRYKHGREVPDDILKQIIEKFPEKERKQFLL